MRIFLRLMAVLMAMSTVIWWSAAGKNTGWTKNKVRIFQIDEITEIEYPVEVDRFVPGIDIPVGGVALAGTLAGLSLLPVFRRKPVA